MIEISVPDNEGIRSAVERSRQHTYFASDTHTFAAGIYRVCDTLRKPRWRTLGVVALIDKFTLRAHFLVPRKSMNQYWVMVVKQMT